MNDPTVRDNIASLKGRVPARQLGIGVVGLGSVFEPHVRGLVASGDARITAVCDLRANVAFARAAELSATAYEDYRALLDDASVDAVVVLLPHDLHYRVVADALDRAKPVLVEKPMAVTVTEAEDLVTRARAQGLVLAVTHNTRFADAYVAAKAAIEDGRIGDLRLIRYHLCGYEVDSYFAPGNEWRRRPHGIGAVIDCAPHFFHLLTWYFGSVASVRAITRTVTPGIEVEDYAAISGDLVDGGHFSMEVNLTAELPWQERLEIYGSAGAIVIDFSLDPVAKLHAGHRDREGTRLPDVPVDPRGWRDASIAAAAADFVAAIVDRRPPNVSGDDGARVMRLVDAAYRSIADDGRPVSV